MKLPRLKEVRELHGWSQAKLAEEADVSRDSISNYETGQREAWPATAKRLADALGVEIADLIAPAQELATAGKAEAPRGAGQAERTTGEFQQALERVLEYPREDVRRDEQAARRVLASEGTPQTRIVDAPEVVAARKFREEFAPEELPIAAGELAVGHAQYERENTNLRAALQERQQRIAQLEEENTRLREEVAKLHEQVASVE